jgi:CBS domain-containing protein
VARLMKNANTGCALVVQGAKLVGIFTEHDVLLRLTDNKMANVNPESGVSYAAASSREDGDSDRVSDAAMVEMPLNEIPASDIPIEELRADAMPVAHTPASYADTTRVNRTAPFDVPVKDLMSLHPETLHEHDSVAEAVNKMSLGRYRHIPFVRSDGTYAVASIKSVLKYIVREDW